ncbi:MAG: 5-oxoprolinase subunit PxpB [Bacteroidales bacterium]|jgi:KipI family sensor histidine kinase inhibitor
MNTTYCGAEFLPAGDSAIIIKAGDEISVEINRTITALLARIEKGNISGITDFIPSYNELMICYNPAVTGFDKLKEAINSLEKDIEKSTLSELKTKVVPVLYGGDYGPDLEDVATHNKLSAHEVIKIHSAGSYLVYMLGFTPGFCYLGGMDQRIAMPRKQTPRLKIPEGAVGIADQQTGIYPIESPGGWQLIGQTPLKLFDAKRKPEFLFNIGDTLRFVPVTEAEYNVIKAEVENGSYKLKTI